jgi:16S rRNA (guanine527-N7)-methyltransferase
MSCISYKIIEEFPDARIADALRPFGIAASADLCQAIREYISSLLLWNQKVNLTSITSPPEILQRHFGESLFAVPAVPIRARRLADVGSGAGFPGLALRLLLPDAEVTLIEPNAKKATFLAEVARKLDLARVCVRRERTEGIELDGPIADVVTARAIGDFDSLLAWSGRALAPAGQLVLWVGSASVPVLQSHASFSWKPPIRIPKSQNRVLLVGQRP